MRFVKQGLIEHYDSAKDPIKLYFMDKMQTTVFNFNKSKEKTEAEDYFENLAKEHKRDSDFFKPQKKFKKELSSGKKLFEIRRAQKEREQFMYHKYQKENKKMIKN